MKTIGFICLGLGVLLLLIARLWLFSRRMQSTDFSLMDYFFRIFMPWTWSRMNWNEAKEPFILYSLSTVLIIMGLIIITITMT